MVLSLLPVTARAMVGVDWSLNETTGALTLSSNTGVNLWTSWIYANTSYRSMVKTVSIGASVTNISYYTFSDCTGLRTFEVDESSSTFCAVDGVLYNKGRSELILYPKAKSGSPFVVPNTVTKIKDYAFDNCDALSSISLGAVEAIGEHAFNDCDGLTGVTFPATLTSLGGYAFWFCDHLADVVFLGALPTTLGETLFAACADDIEIHVPSAYLQNYKNSVGNFVLEYGEGDADVNHINPIVSASGDGWSLRYNGLLTIDGDDGMDDWVAWAENNDAYLADVTAVSVTSGVTAIDEDAFSGCSNLTSVILPYTVISIGNGAFSGCSALTTVRFRGAVPSFDDGIFSDSTSTLANIYVPFDYISNYEEALPASYESIISSLYIAEGDGWVLDTESLLTIDDDDGMDAWVADGGSYHGNVTAVSIAPGVAGIGDGAFAGCTALMSITLPSFLEAIGGSAFSGCTSLTGITLPTFLETIGDDAFSDCTSLMGITLPNFLETIGDNAFAGCTGLMVITLPDSLETIGDGAFGICTGLVSVNFGNSLTSIGAMAFAGCIELMDITLPDSLETVGYSAFADCTSLTSVTIGSSVSAIGSAAFSGCAALGAFHVKDGNSVFCVVDGVLYSKDQSVLVQYPMAKTGASFTVPDLVTTVGSYAFYHCTQLTSIDLGSKVENIGEKAFTGCAGLTDVTLPDSVKTVGDAAFAECAALMMVVFSGEVPDSIGDNIFYGNDSTLKHIYVPSSDVDDYLGAAELSAYSARISATPYAFGLGWALDDTGTLTIERDDGMLGWLQDGGSYHGDVSMVVLNPGVTVVGEGAFYGCPSLESVSIPASVTFIGNGAFAFCPALATFMVGPGSGYFSAVDGVLYNQNQSTLVAYPGGKLENSFTVPASVTTIIEGAFTGNHLTSIAVGDGNLSFTAAEGVLYNAAQTALIAYPAAKSDTSFPVPGTVSSIWGGAFAGVVHLTSVTLPSGVTTIGVGAFADSALTEINLPETVTTIGIQAFWACTGLTEITLPSSLDEIGAYAFADCTGLTGVTFRSAAPPAGLSETTFDGDAELSAITVPSSGREAYQAVLGSYSDIVRSASGGATTPVLTPVVSGATATTTVTPTVINGAASASVTQAQMNKAIAAAQAAAEANGETPRVEISLGTASGATSAAVTIPRTSLQALVSGGLGSLTVSSGVATVTFDADALSTISGAATGDVTVTVARTDAASLSEAAQALVGDRPVYQFSVTSGGTTISGLGGTATAAIPYTPAAGEDLNAIVLYYVQADGSLETVTNGRYDAATGTVVFTTTHFSDYAVGYNKVGFTDVSDSAWYADAVTWLAARGVTSGTTATTFSPDATLTRGQFITLLLRAYDIEAIENASDNFSDAGDTYYTGYLAAAKALGISNGVGDNRFAPEQAITRQEMFTLLYNALKTLDLLPEDGSGNTLSDFTDSGSVASYAQEAMAYLVENGVVNGNDGLLNPSDTSTRAQMAQVLYNLLSK